MSSAIVRKKRYIVVALVCLAVIAAGIGVYLWLVGNRAAQQASSDNQFTRQIAVLKSQSLPSEPLDQAIYYAQLGQNYAGLGDNHMALSYYLKAQKAIDDAKLQDQIVYYQAIADTYHTLNDKTNELIYLKLQLTHVQQFLQANPDDAASKAAEQTLKDRISRL